MVQVFLIICAASTQTCRVYYSKRASEVDEKNWSFECFSVAAFLIVIFWGSSRYRMVLTGMIIPGWVLSTIPTSPQHATTGRNEQQTLEFSQNLRLTTRREGSNHVTKQTHKHDGWSCYIGQAPSCVPGGMEPRTYNSIMVTLYSAVGAWTIWSSQQQERQHAGAFEIVILISRCHHGSLEISIVYMIS